MSHYTVMVCLPGTVTDLDAALSLALAPYDENMTVEPRKDYEDDSPEECTAIWVVRTNAKHHRDGDGVLPYKPDGLGSSTAWSKKTEAEQRAEFAAAAELEQTFPSPMTWEFAARFANERYETPEFDEDGSLNHEYIHVDEDGRAFTWTTYNPDSKWDYWRIGGRWSGYFTAKEMTPEVLLPGSHWDGPKGIGRGLVDGGPKRLLDFDAMREKAGIEADERYSRYEKLVSEHGTAKPWSHFYGLVEVKALDWDTARAQYGEQPLIMAHRQLPYEQQLTGMGCLVDEFFLPRVEYILAARAARVPAYATLTLSGEWAAPGQMGWWGASSDDRGDREAYHVAMNKYLDDLKPDTLLVVLDCHI